MVAPNMSSVLFTASEYRRYLAFGVLPDVGLFPEFRSERFIVSALYAVVERAVSKDQLALFAAHGEVDLVTA